MLNNINTINSKHSPSTSGLIIDGRSITQVLYIYSIFSKEFGKKNTILIWKGKNSDLILLSKIIKLPKKTFVFDINSQDVFLFFNMKAIRNLKFILAGLKNKSTDYSICSCYASGLYFELIKEYLAVKNENVILFDDGLINEYVIKRKYRTLRFIMNLIHGFIFFPSKYILFSDVRYKSIFTSLNPRNVTSYSSKRVVNIAPNIKCLFRKISSRYININKPNSVVFMTAPLVESGRMEKNQYQEFILKVFLKIKTLGFETIYLSKHPSESNVSDIFYRKIGFNISYANFPSEIIILNRNIRSIINPLNSTLFLSDQLGLLDRIKIVISYVPVNAPFIVSRICKINNLLATKKITHHIITNDK